MNFEDLPLRHPRDIFVQDACRAIRRTLNSVACFDVDFWSAFVIDPNFPPSPDALSIRRVFDTMANDRRLTPGEKMLLIGILLQDRSTAVIQTEMLREPR